MNIKSIPLEAWQYDLIELYNKNSSNSIITVKAKRQVGKSIALEQLLLMVGLNKAGSFSIYITPTMNQSRKIFREIVALLEDKNLMVKKNETLLEINLINGSQLTFKSAEQRDSLRGFTVSGILIIDEAAYIADDILYLLLPTTDVHQVTTVISSTPKFKQGFFYEYFIQGLEGLNNCVSIDWNDYNTSKYLSKSKLELYRTLFAPQQFESEYLGNFISGFSTLFENFEESISDTLGQKGKTYFGIDWSSGVGKDYTVISIFNEAKELFEIHYFNDKGTNDTIDYIYQLMKKYKPVRTIVEKNSIGQIFYSALSDAASGLNLSIEPFVTTNISKKGIIDDLIMAFQNKEIKILKDKKLINELSFYESKVSSTGLMTYNAPSGFHDDTVIACALGYKAVKTINYSVL